jgi:SpoIVB peptidase S55
VPAAKLLLLLALPVLLTAQVSIYPLSEVKAGLKATGRTVFAGSAIEDFDVEILGVLENVGPKQSVILARLSGGPIARTGVLQGMSGSPVYVDGRLMGAVALAFPLSKEPLAGIRPIEEMLREGGASPMARSGGTSLWARNVTAGFAGRAEYMTGGSRLVDISTPVSFRGMTRRTLEEFGPELQKLGLEPMQGASGGTSGGELGDPALVKPGSMISVLLLSGDMTVGADGTVTHVDGERIYAFGHRFLAVGNTELPFARSEVITLAPNLSTSFKISSSKELMGAITSDHSTAVQGVLGKQAATVPVNIRVTGPGGSREQSYSMRMVNDRYLSPFLAQMAVYSALDATERVLGTSTVSLKGQVEFENGLAPVRLDEVYSGAGNIPLQTSLGTAIPMAYLLQSGFEAMRLKSVDLELTIFDERRQWVIESVWPRRKTVRPGETAELMVLLSGENGEEQTHTIPYAIPVGASAGTIHFTVSDAMTTNLLEYSHIVGQRMKNADQVVKLVNGLRNNAGAYVRVWRAEQSYRVQGSTLPAPPPSVSLILGRGRSRGSNGSTYTAKLDEIPIRVQDAAVSGSKSTQVEVKE